MEQKENIKGAFFIGYFIMQVTSWLMALKKTSWLLALDKLPVS